MSVLEERTPNHPGAVGGLGGLIAGAISGLLSGWWNRP
jgi:hypothetical protein